VKKLLLLGALFLGGKAWALTYDSGAAAGMGVSGGITGGTQGSVLFVSTGAILGQNNSQFFWSEPNAYLGISTGTPQATLDVQGSRRWKATVYTTTSSVAATDSVVLASASTNGIQFTLPGASTATVGRVIDFYRIDASTQLCTIIPAGGDTINSLTSKSLNGMWQAVRITGVSASQWLAEDTEPRQISFEIDGGGSTITTGFKSMVRVPYDMIVTGWVVHSEDTAGAGTGSIVVDIWCDTEANFPPTVADTIAGSEKPTVTASNKGQDVSLTSFNRFIAAGAVCGANVDSVTTFTKVNVAIYGTAR